jgi:hypothetical protein
MCSTEARTGARRGERTPGRYARRVLVVAAVCPHPPLLVPDVAAGAAAETDALRTACTAAASLLVAAAPDGIVVVGGGPATRAVAAAETGSLAAYGVPVTFALDGRSQQPPSLPLSLTIAAWLLTRIGYGGPVAGHVVTADQPAAACAELGDQLSGRQDRVGLLVMGDGSARRSTAAPGYLDERAAAFDAAAAAALGTADPDALLALDAKLADQLLAAGRAPWQVLAGAAAAAGGSWSGELRHDDAPYGVGYLVATWTRK